LLIHPDGNNRVGQLWAENNDIDQKNGNMVAKFKSDIYEEFGDLDGIVTCCNAS
jgi:hypothetical protein